MLFLLSSLYSAQSFANKGDAITLRQVILPGQKLENIKVEQNLDTEDLSNLIRMASSLSDYKEWKKFLDRNISLTGIQQSIAKYNKATNSNISIADTTTRFIFFDIRLREIPIIIEDIVTAGGKVEIYVDSSNVKAFSHKEDPKWDTRQKEIYLKQYDKNKDGKVDSKDIEQINTTRYLGIKIFERLYEIQKKYSKLLKIKVLPEMLVPNKGQLYPPIMHAKATYTFVNETGQPIRSAEYNSNLTPNELHGRLEPSRQNMNNYLAGNPFKLLPQAEPYPQMAAEFSFLLAPVINEILAHDKKAFELLFKEGHFTTKQKYTAKTYRYNGTGNSYMDIRVHHAYGNKDDFKPWDSMAKFLNNKNNTIQSLQSAQFVFSNTLLMEAITNVLKDKNNFKDHNIPASEKISIIINSDHGLQSWSQLWKVFSKMPYFIKKDTLHMDPGLLSKQKGPQILDQRRLDLNSELLREAFKVYWSKAVFNVEQMEELPNLERNITPSKNHSKVMAVKYQNATNGEERYRILISSANASQNAGSGTYEHTIEIDTANSQLYEKVKEHVQSLNKHRRTTDFTQTYMRLLLYSLYKKPHRIFQEIEQNEQKFPIEWDKEVIEKFIKIYKQKDLAKIIKKLEEYSHIKRGEGFNTKGERFLAYLRHLKSTSKNINDDLIYQLWRLSLQPSGEKSKALEKFILDYFNLPYREIKGKSCRGVTGAA